ncbi:MAG: type IV pilus biogenesis/stability protein PilW [Azoarcus sp.]|jgi:type IV pilus assembly protein PilF|nr:type IV pilus biogenesis/stability protein PilW [Azoarcus sp.]
MTRTMKFCYWIASSAFVLVSSGCETMGSGSGTGTGTGTGIVPGGQPFTSISVRPTPSMSERSPEGEAENRARAHTDLGGEYLSMGQAGPALDEARIALDAKSGYGIAYHLMGLAYMEIGQNAEADEAFRQALAAAPGDPDFNNSYGWFLCRRGRVSEGLSRLDFAARNPYYRYKTRPYTNAGLCLMNNNDLARAEEQFSMALDADSSNGEALYRLADVVYRRGEYRRAHDLLVQYHRFFGVSARTAWLGLRTARRVGERHVEASYAEQLRNRFAGSPEHALMTQGRYE